MGTGGSVFARRVLLVACVFPAMRTLPLNVAAHEPPVRSRYAGRVAVFVFFSAATPSWTQRV